MVAGFTATIRSPAGRLSYDGADRLAREILAERKGGNVLLDLSDTTETCTAALARLVVLRRHMLETGGDVSLRIPRGRCQYVYTVWHFDALLPSV